jgi:hypothetical protein
MDCHSTPVAGRTNAAPPALPAGPRAWRRAWRCRCRRAEPAVGDSPCADPLPQAGRAHQVGGELCVFSLGDIPGHHLAAPDVDHQVEIQPHTPHRGGQIGDVPRHHSIGAIRS